MKYTQETIMTLAKNESYSFDTRIADLIDIGIAELGLDLGIVSQIVEKTYTIMYSNDAESVGEKFQLGNTYCSITLNLPSENVLAINHFSVSDYFRHPCYEKFKLETYIGIPILVNGERYGTLNFTQAEARENGFSDEEKTFIQWLATAIGYVLTQKSAQA